MADIRLIRGRTTVRIQLYPQDLRDIIVQADVLSELTEEELKQISGMMNLELNRRELKNDTGNT